MESTLMVEGFGLDPDAAVTDLRHRCERYAASGWTDPLNASVFSGRNPYSDIAVYGYVATTTLTKTD